MSTAETRNELSEASAPERDFLDEIISDCTAIDPAFPQLYAAAVRERALLRTLTERRIAAGISQRDLARRMGTSQPAIARLERGETDPRLSTVERFAAAIGQEIEWRLRRVTPQE